MKPAKRIERQGTGRGAGKPNLFGLRRLVAAFPAWATCHPSRTASSGAPRITNGTWSNWIARPTTIDGDESPAESDDESSHSKVPALRLQFIHGATESPPSPPGWKPRLYVSQDGRRYNFQTPSYRMFAASSANSERSPFWSSICAATAWSRKRLTM